MEFKNYLGPYETRALVCISFKCILYKVILKSKKSGTFRVGSLIIFQSGPSDVLIIVCFRALQGAKGEKPLTTRVISAANCIAEMHLWKVSAFQLNPGICISARIFFVPKIK